MTKFESGDIVKCIDNSNVDNLEVGVNYRVGGCTKDYVRISIDQGNYPYKPYIFSVDRFCKAEEPVTYVWPKYSLTDDEDECDNTKSKKEALYVLVKEFIKYNGIYCGETIYQTDHVIKNAYGFIQDICEIVGYAK